ISSTAFIAGDLCDIHTFSAASFNYLKNLHLNQPIHCIILLKIACGMGSEDGIWRNLGKFNSAASLSLAKDLFNYDNYNYEKT
ncbi:MAG: hypothetical protein QXQ02_08520, partial [Halobacteria archaeon]